MSSGGISVYRILSGYKSFGKPVRRDDGRWLVRDICAASSAIALGHTLAGIEEYTDPEHKVRVTWVFEASATFEADYERFERGESVPIRRFLDSFFALYHIAKSRPGKKLPGFDEGVPNPTSRRESDKP
jgi:hypothetical protein